jgi:hypothetical protein
MSDPRRPPPVAIVGAGLCCSVGHTSLDAYASMRAGITRFRRTYLRGVSGALTAAPVLPITKGCEGSDRGGALLEVALDECFKEVGASMTGSEVGLFTCYDAFEWIPALGFAPHAVQLAEDLKRRWSQFYRDVAARLTARGVRINPHVHYRFAGGHAVGVRAFGLAAMHVERGDIETAFIIGVSSQCERASLEGLDLLNRTKSELSPLGFIPSEAAAIVAVARRDDSHVTADAISYAEDPDPPRRRRNARGMGTALCGTIAKWGGDLLRIDEAWNDQNGEAWRADEWSVAALRALARPGHHTHVVHPAGSLGDIASATVPSLIAMGRYAANERDQPILVASSSRDKTVGSLLLLPPGEASHGR